MGIAVVFSFAEGACFHSYEARWAAGDAPSATPARVHGKLTFAIDRGENSFV